MEHAEDERGPHLKIDWGINDIRMLHDSVSFYRDKGEIDFDSPYGLGTMTLADGNKKTCHWVNGNVQESE